MEQKKDKVRKAKKILKRHVVVFQDEEGTVLKTSFVTHGQAAEPPGQPDHKGSKHDDPHYNYVFDGWNQDYSSVNTNLVLKPVYRKEPKKYLVMYYHENGRFLGMESVAYKSPASQPYHPEKDSDDAYDYPFIGWTKDLSSVEADTNAKAVFGKVRRVFTVRFYHENGSLLKEEKVRYDESATPPEHVSKEADPVYHYVFAGWSYPLDHIRSSLNIHAVFQYIYNEYTVTFYDGATVVDRGTYHYEEPLPYPELSKKGYDLIWDKEISNVREDEEIHAGWLFSNPKGRIIRTDLGSFRILDPSIHQGKVSCVSYRSQRDKKVSLPASVKLGDYYYKITEIESGAFSGCEQMEKLVLPDSINKIYDGGISKCRNLKCAELGKGIRQLGKGIFAGDGKLVNVVLKARNQVRADREVLLHAPKRLEIRDGNGSIISL